MSHFEKQHLLLKCKIMNLRRSGRAEGRPRMSIIIIPFVLASFGSLVLSYVTIASGGAASPALGGQRTPRGKGKGMGKNK